MIEAALKMRSEIKKKKYKLSNILSFLGFVFSFIVLSDYYLAFLFGSGVAAFSILRGQLEKLLNKAEGFDAPSSLAHLLDEYITDPKLVVCNL